jgi:hypothetical protein
LTQKQEKYIGLYMKARHLIFLFVLLACFLLPSHAGQAGEEAGACPKPFIKSIFPWTGKPGDVVIIQGERFGSPPGEVIFTRKFIFNFGVKAEISSWTFHRIWVKVPKSASTGSIFVRVHCGAKSNKRDFTVNE